MAVPRGEGGLALAGQGVHRRLTDTTARVAPQRPIRAWQPCCPDAYDRFVRVMVPKYHSPNSVKMLGYHGLENGR